MSVLYLCNVGVRDLRLDGEPLRPCRTEGEKALKQYDQLKDRLSAPIISPGLDFALAENGAIDRLILFATDQPEGVEERFRENDTVHAAEAIRKLLLATFNTKLATRIREVKVKPIKDQNPSHYDEMFEYFGRQMATKDLRLDDLERCYVAPAGGIPAANTGLILQAVSAFGDRCRVMSVGESDGVAQPIRFGDQLRTAARKEVIQAHLATRAFAQALPFLEQVGASPLAIGLARYAKHRLYFDFDEARRAIVKAVEVSSGEDRRLCEQLRGDLQALTDRSVEALAVELYHNARITYGSEQYVDFLGRAFRFQECALQLAVKRIYDEVLDDEDYKHRQKLEQLANSNPYLKAYLDAATVGNNPLDWHRINIPVLRALVRYAAEPGGGKKADGTSLLGEDERPAFGEIYALTGKLASLEQLRNKCIIAHGFKGVSREILLEAYNKDAPLATDPLEDMVRVLELLGMSTSAGPYERVVEAITRMMERF